ncbi:MAG: branched-chain amino acid ABC transporter permease [Lachnospiraceae bacterium]|nr:branched-chain amino acid ABC transporter permease [Lachnospiraceae bacterium]MBR6909577.1 branched-chain amino acid ABC transporter permease [Lachnospiraceae bacterium]
MGKKINFLGKTNKNSLMGLINFGIIIVFFAIVTILKGAGGLTNALEGQLIPICAYIIMALSLNLVVGISGELSLGHAGFMSVGAFTGVIVAGAMKYNGVNANLPRLIVAIVVGAILAAIAGILIGIPVLRLRGDYLAIVTLAFGEIIKNVLNCLYVGVDAAGLHFSVTDEAHMDMAAGGTTLVRGPMGAVGISKASSFTAGIVLILLVLFVIQNLVNSRTGRAIMAIRDNRIAAEASGINVTKYKMIAFVTSAAIAGAAGALYALNYSTIVPKKFDFNTSILVLVFVVLGGIGNMTGSIIAAAVLTILPELFRQFQDYRMLVYAIVLILVMIATNSEKIRALWKRFTGLFSSKKGGSVNE